MHWSLIALLILAAGSAGVRGAAAGETLADAVRGGDVAAVRRLLAAKADVNRREPDGTTALHWAVHRDDVRLVGALLRAGARASLANDFGVAPLSLACTGGNPEIVRRLIDAGADVNAALPGGETPLMTAARTGQPEVIRLLLARGADVNAREEARGQTALMWAAAEGNAAAIRALVEGGADTQARSRPPSSIKALPGPGRAMGQGLDGGGGRVDTLTPMLFAARAGHIDAVRTLIELGGNVNETAPDGSSLLVVAGINAHWELMVWLVDHGADPDAAAQGWTPLHQIARTRTLALTRFPLPVPTGAASGTDAAEALLKHGTHPNARMTKNIADGYRNSIRWIGATPFYLAAKGVDVALMKTLLAYGADPMLPNDSGTTPLMAAAGIEIHYLGEDDGAPADAFEAVRMLVDLGADVGARNAAGETALHGAARRGNNPMVQLLLSKGAPLDVRNRKGWTPLTVALGFEKGNAVALFQSEQNMLETARILRDSMIEKGIALDESPDALRLLSSVAEGR